MIRLSLTQGVPSPESDVTGAAAVYLIPNGGNEVPIWDGTGFTTIGIGAGLAAALDSDGTHAGFHQQGKNFDWFLVDDGGVPRIGTGPAWSNNNTRSAGLEDLGGVVVNDSQITIRCDPSLSLVIPERRGTYIGSFRATADGQATDSKARRLLFNVFSPIMRAFGVADPAASWTYSAPTFRQMHGLSSNQVEILLGLSGVAVAASLTAIVANSSGTERAGQCAIGVDSLSPAQDSTCGFVVVKTLANAAYANYAGYPGVGFHTLTLLEKGGGYDTQTWYGSSASQPYRSGLTGHFLG